MPRRVYVAEAEIEAPREVAWEVLADLDGYPRWNPFTVEVRGALVAGEPVHMRVRMEKLGVAVKQTETVREIVDGERIVWGMTMLGGLVRAERVQTLEALGSERARYRTEDTIEGALGWIVFTFFGPSIEHGFRGVAEALAREAAERARTAEGRGFGAKPQREES